MNESTRAHVDEQPGQLHGPGAQECPFFCDNAIRNPPLAVSAVLRRSTPLLDAVCHVSRVVKLPPSSWKMAPVSRWIPRSELVRVNNQPLSSVQILLRPYRTRDTTPRADLASRSVRLLVVQGASPRGLQERHPQASEHHESGPANVDAENGYDISKSLSG